MYFLYIYKKISKIQSLDLLFLVVFMVFISFYISRYFSQVFRTSFNIIWRKDFCHKFSFFNGLIQPPPSTHHHPLNSQNPLSMIILFCQCSLTDHDFSRLLCYDNARRNQKRRAELILQSNFNSKKLLPSCKPLDWS